MCVNNLSKVALDSAAAEIEPAISSRKFNALTTTPPSHTDDDSRHFCCPVPIKTLSYDSCVTINIHHYCLDTCGPCNN